MVEIGVWLYGKPCWELELEEDKINPELIKKHGEYLKEHLDRISQTILKLQKNGWVLSKSFGNTYDICFCNKKIKTLEEAESALTDLNIDLSSIAFLDFE